jgi:acyl carrier protein
MNKIVRSIFFARNFSTIPKDCYLDPKEVAIRVIDVVKTMRSAPEKIDSSLFFVKDLNFDSSQRKELYGKFAEEFCVPLEYKETESFLSIDSVVKYFSNHSKAR